MERNKGHFFLFTISCHLWVSHSTWSSQHTKDVSHTRFGFDLKVNNNIEGQMLVGGHQGLSVEIFPS